MIDTHTHFDIAAYDADRDGHNIRAYEQGVRDVVLIGFVARYFEQMVRVKQYADTHYALRHHLAFGLHPLYIAEHSDEDLIRLDRYLATHDSVAVAEIGLDTYPEPLRTDALYQKQIKFFVAQIELAKQYDLPILLHIRKAHADVLKLLKQQKYNAHTAGGIAHSFSGGVQEALAFVQMGFKLGITGQITNPNAKKLRRAVSAVYERHGASAFVLETDCPDMMPVPCQHLGSFNEPANLVYVLDALAQLFEMERAVLAQTLWTNSAQALKLKVAYEGQA